MVNISLEDKIYIWICDLYREYQSEMMDTKKNMCIQLYQKRVNKDSIEKKYMDTDDKNIIFLNGNPFHEEYGKMDINEDEEDEISEDEISNLYEYQISIQLSSENEENKVSCLFECNHHHIFMDCVIPENMEYYYMIEPMKREYSFCEYDEYEILRKMKDYIYELFMCYMKTL
jgi:hypothetical protein